jgi:hypothetical protein
MTRLICPPRELLGELRTPLTAGESRVLDFFDQLLPEGWEIYVQPHLNGLRPDFVLLHPVSGIAVFEVKDWDLDAMPFAIRSNSSYVSLWCQNRGCILADILIYRAKPSEKSDIYVLGSTLRTLHPLPSA